MELRTDEGLAWGGVALAASATARLRGLIAARHDALLIRTRAVHGFWIGRPIWIVGLDGAGVVVDCRLLRKRRLAFFRQATWVLELPAPARLPEVGQRLTLWARPGEPVTHGRPPLSVRHSDRQPG